MRHILFYLLAAIVLFVPAVIAQGTEDPAATTASTDPTNVPEVTVVGAWNVAYTLGPTTVTRQVRFIAYSDRTGKFITGSGPVTTVNAVSNAVWDDPAPFFNFSGEVRIPLGNVGVETGTLVFKAINGNTGLLNCKVVYVQNNSTVASTAMYTIKTGTCVATRITATP